MTQLRGDIRRFRIVRFLRENPGKRTTAIARAVGLAIHHGTSPTLESHLNLLERAGLVRQCELLRWWPIEEEAS